MAGAHAKLSPSAAERWLACPASVRLSENIPNTTSVYAEEGSFAHAVGEILLLHEFDYADHLEALKNTPAGKRYYSDTLFSYAQDYADFVRRNVTEGAKLFVECKLDLSRWIPEGFGTGDAIVIKDDEMFFDDLKYGMGVPVSAVNNKQLMIYALGALDAFGFMYDIKKVTMSIYQPRIDNISSWQISVEELLDWAENELAPKAKIAWDGSGETVAGNHCKFCPVGAQCRKLAEYNLEIARHEFFGQDPELLSLDEIGKLLDQSETMQIWVKLLYDYAFKKALEGEKVAGYKIVEGRSTRKYSSEQAVQEALDAANVPRDSYLTEPSLKGLTALEKAVGKDTFRKVVEPLLIKPEGAPTLVKESDKRPEFSSAASDFKDLIG